MTSAATKQWQKRQVGGTLGDWVCYPTFLAAGLEKKGAEQWQLAWQPLIGRDEAGLKRHHLTQQREGLFSCKYCLPKYRRGGEEDWESL